MGYRDNADRALDRMEARRPSVHNGLAITAFIMTWIFPPLGVILGMVSVGEAHRDGRYASGLAVAAIILGLLFILIYVIIIASIVSAADQNSLTACTQLNPAWPNC